MAHTSLSSLSTSISLPSAAIKGPVRSAYFLPQLPSSKITTTGISSYFKSGVPLVISISSNKKGFQKCNALPSSIRCEQSAKGSNGSDVWLGRLAMIGFATAISVEVITGRGLLENFGFTTPIPTLALAVTALVGVLTAFFIFQSASRD